MPLLQFVLAVFLVPLLAVAEAEIESSPSIDAPEIRAKFTHQTEPDRTVLQITVKSEEATTRVSAYLERGRAGSTEQTPWDIWSAMTETADGEFELTYPGKVEALELVVFVWTESTGHRYTFAPGSSEPKTTISRAKQEWQPAKREAEARTDSRPTYGPRYRSSTRRFGSRPSIPGPAGGYPQDPRAQALADQLAAQHGSSLQSRLDRVTQGSHGFYGNVAAGQAGTDSAALAELHNRAKFTPRAYARQVSGNSVIWVAIP